MSGIQKNLQYKSSRSTRLLNNSSKDNFGRQRHAVLFGFDISPASPSSNKINVSAGAGYTQDGQKIFAYNDIAATLELSPESKSRVEMYVVVLEHQYNADTSINNPEFKIVRVTDWLPRTIEPVKDIKEQNIISGFISSSSPTLYHSKMNPIEGYNVGGFDNLTYGEDDILGYNQIPISKIIINWDLVSGNIIDSDGKFKDGVAIYSYKNPWEQLQDYVGVDVFEPTQTDTNGNDTLYLERWNDNVVAVSGNSPFIGVDIVDSNGDIIDHNHIAYGRYETAQEDRTPTNNPLYGYFSNNDTRARYKYSSFLDDGHSIKWNLQRLSETVRIIESKIGSHPSSPVTKTYQSFSPKMISENISESKINNTYDSRGNFILKNGSVGWFKPSIGDGFSPTDDYESLSTTTLADNHHTAITMIDRAIGYISRNRLGLSGIVNLSEINRDDIYSYNKDLSSVSFDRESWNSTDLPGDPGNGATLKQYIQHLVDYKLHRDYGYVDSWINFGSISSTSRSESKTLKDYYDSNGIEYWLDSSTNILTAADNSQVHIGNKGIVSYKFVNDIDNQEWPDYYRYGIQVSPSDELVSLGVGVQYPTTIKVETPLYDTAGNPKTINVPGEYYNRSTIIGGSALNFSTAKFYDIEAIANVPVTPIQGGLCTITWNDVNRNTSGTVVGTIIHSRIDGSNARIKLKINEYVGYQSPMTYVSMVDANAEDIFDIESRYSTPWTAISTANDYLENLGYNSHSAGYATISLTQGNFQIVPNNKESEFSESIYNGAVNIVDRISGDPTFRMETKKGAPYARNRSYIPLQVDDWIIFGVDNNIESTYINTPPKRGYIIGSEVGMSANTVSIEANNRLILNSKEIVIPSGSKLIVEDGASLEVNGEINLSGNMVVSGNGRINVKDSGAIDFMSGGGMILSTGSASYFQTRDGEGWSIFEDYFSTFSAGAKDEFIYSSTEKVANPSWSNADVSNYTSSLNFAALSYVQLEVYNTNQSRAYEWWNPATRDSVWLPMFSFGQVGYIKTGRVRTESIRNTKVRNFIGSQFTWPNDTVAVSTTIDGVQIYLDIKFFSYLNNTPIFQNVGSSVNITCKLSTSASNTVETSLLYSSGNTYVIILSQSLHSTFLDNIKGVSGLNIEMKINSPQSWQELYITSTRIKVQKTETQS